MLKNLSLQCNVVYFYMVGRSAFNEQFCLGSVWKWCVGVRATSALGYLCPAHHPPFVYYALCKAGKGQCHWGCFQETTVTIAQNSGMECWRLRVRAASS
eukprot:5952553-Amphidinium_carterae.1